VRVRRMSGVPARGYGPLADQLRRARLGTYLNLAEAAARDGNDRRQLPLRASRGQ
jgi:hypothetical protein